ncbi:DUF2779 domain-containing protein [Bacteroidota bacterium]
MQKYQLSKSTFIRGLQCEKSLYLYKHHYDLKDEITQQLQAIFDQGNAVGLLAQELFPEGVDASPEDHFKIQESVLKTQDYLDKEESIIYEATFQYNGVLAALDILVKEEDGWKAYEVKSSTSVSDTYLNDATIQFYTIVNSGIDLKDISIVYINNQYVKNGVINVSELFTIESVYDKVQTLLPDIPKKIASLKEVIHNGSQPNIDIGPHCSKPYDCDFMGHCWKHVPEYSIFDISGMRINKKMELYSNGILTIDQVDKESSLLNATQKLQIVSEQKGTIHIDNAKVQGFIQELIYPLYYLDFETMGPAIPIFDQSKPYQQLVFQYSLHIENEAGTVSHKEYLAEANPRIDPRTGFMKRLIEDCGTEGDVLVYNIGFERNKLQDLISVYPRYNNEINNIIRRLKDLMIPFQKKWYYTPEMKGSYSIKYVLPALVPELSYADLEIKEGGTASTIFTQMLLGEHEGDIEKTRKALLAYCELDTRAMVEILKVLKASTIPN